MRSAITGTGLWVPERVDQQPGARGLAPRRPVEAWNAAHAGGDRGRAAPRRATPRPTRGSCSASGIRSRYVIEKSGLLDPARLRPHLPLRGEDELSRAGGDRRSPRRARRWRGPAARAPEVDAVLVACSNLQRPYPAVAIEVQHALGAAGLRLRPQRRLLVGDVRPPGRARRGRRRPRALRARDLSPEITSGHNNFALREFHFIFGDACTAVVVEPEDRAPKGAFRVLASRLQTQLLEQHPQRLRLPELLPRTARASPASSSSARTAAQVFREVCPLVSELILRQLAERGPRARGAPAPLAPPGEPRHERADREDRARPRPEARRSAR